MISLKSTEPKTTQFHKSAWLPGLEDLPIRLGIPYVVPSQEEGLQDTQRNIPNYELIREIWGQYPCRDPFFQCVISFISDPDTFLIVLTL